MAYIPYLVPVSTKGVVIEDEKVWLRKNERNEWELPGGKIDPGEQPEETVARELLEELGFHVEVKDIVGAHMYTIQKSIDESYGVLVVSYLCDVISKMGQFELIGEAGQSEFKKFPLKEVDLLNMPDFYKIAIQNALTRL